MHWGWLVFLCQTLFAATSSFEAAEYYYNRQDLKQAIELYRLIDDPRSIARIADAKLILQGRKEARDEIVAYLKNPKKNLPEESRSFLYAKLDSILDKFVTDEGQSLYFRALNKVRYGDYVSAVGLVETAVGLEGTNTRALELKSTCEKELKKYEAYSLTLNTIFLTDPFDFQNAEKLSETYFYLGEYAKLRDTYTSVWKEGRSPYLKFLDLIASVELGKSSLPIYDLEGYSETFPLAYYYLGKEFSKTEEEKTEAAESLTKFLSAMKAIPSWDPLHLTEKVADAKKILEKIQPK